MTITVINFGANRNSVGPQCDLLLVINIDDDDDDDNKSNSNSNNRPVARGGGNPPPQKSLHKKFWVYLFAERLSMCSLRMLL